MALDTDNMLETDVCELVDADELLLCIVAGTIGDCGAIVVLWTNAELGERMCWAFFARSA